MRRGKSMLVLILLLIFGAVIGSVLTELVSDSPHFSWLAFSKQFGISTANPLVVNLGIVNFTFGMMFDISVSSIIGVIIAILVYRKM